MRDYSELERLAEAATQGPWGYAGSYVCPARVEDGTTYVESWRAVADCARPENTKFIAAANPAAVLALIAENKRLRAGMKGDYDLDAWLDWTQEVDGLRKDADRYQWLRDKSEAVHQFYLSVPLWFKGVRFRAQDVDKAIDAMSKGEQS